MAEQIKKQPRADQHAPDKENSNKIGAGPGGADRRAAKRADTSRWVGARALTGMQTSVQNKKLVSTATNLRGTERENGWAVGQGGRQVRTDGRAGARLGVDRWAVVWAGKCKQAGGREPGDKPAHKKNAPTNQKEN